jgi:CheY-like chemotaxis protein
VVVDMQKIIVIDDDKDDRFFFKLALQEIDSEFIFIEAKEGLEGLEILTSSTELPDFIFLDINMPRMNGIECLKQLKKNERLKEIPVIMCSTTTFNEKECMENGAAYFMNKPPDYTQLPDTIMQALEEAKKAKGEVVLKHP